MYYTDAKPLEISKNNYEPMVFNDDLWIKTMRIQCFQEYFD